MTQNPETEAHYITLIVRIAVVRPAATRSWFPWATKSKTENLRGQKTKKQTKGKKKKKPVPKPKQKTTQYRVAISNQMQLIERIGGGRDVAAASVVLAFPSCIGRTNVRAHVQGMMMLRSAARLRYRYNRRRSFFSSCFLVFFSLFFLSFFFLLVLLLLYRPRNSTRLLTAYTRRWLGDEGGSAWRRLREEERRSGEKEEQRRGCDDDADESGRPGRKVCEENLRSTYAEVYIPFSYATATFSFSSARILWVDFIVEDFFIFVLPIWGTFTNLLG